MATEAYYIYPDIVSLASATGEERKRLCRRIAVHVGDRRVLRTLFGIDPEEFIHFYPDLQPKELTTEATIDTFLDNFGKKENASLQQPADKVNDESNRKSPAGGVVPVDAPVIDYAGYLEEENPAVVTEEDSDDTTTAIDAFLKTVPPQRPRPRRSVVAKAEDTNEHSPLTEGLARIMIKNRNYQKALEIITKLSLKNPKKSIYFADQIRFLKKLIINETKQ